MAGTVRENKASTLRCQLHRHARIRPDLWKRYIPRAYSPPGPTSSAGPPKSELPVLKDHSEASLEHVNPSLVPPPGSRIPVRIGQDRRTDPEASSEHRARSASCVSVPETSSMLARSTGGKGVTFMPFPSRQNIEAEHKKLEQIQAAFMQMLQSVADQGHKLPGVYKFVTFTDESKCVLQEGDSKNIPLASSRAENEKRLVTELASKDLIIIELKKKLLLSEELNCEQALRLDASNRAQMEKDEILKFLNCELSSAKNLYNQLCSRFKEVDLNLELATKQVTEKTITFEEELKTLSEKHEVTLAIVREQEEKLQAATAEAALHSQAEAQLRKDLDRMNGQLDLNHQLLEARADMITKLQQSERTLRDKFEEIFRQVGEKNTRINQLRNELDAKDEQFRYVMVNLKRNQGSLRRQENIIKLLEEQGVRTSLMRVKQEERTAAMQVEMAQLRQNLRNQTHVMVVNDGKLFFGDVQAENAHTSWQQQPSQQEGPAQEQHQLQ